MSNYMTFTVGDPFPLPIQNQQDGGMFQVDDNGIMFLLQLSRSDLVASEAFRNGEVELALALIDEVLFLLYRIDGIFKDGWGDAPLSLPMLPEEHLPTVDSLAKDVMYLYLVDTNLKILLAQREVSVNSEEPFIMAIRDYVNHYRKSPFTKEDLLKRIDSIYKKLSPAELRKKAIAAKNIPLEITSPKR